MSKLQKNQTGEEKMVKQSVSPRSLVESAMSELEDAYAARFEVQEDLAESCANVREKIEGMRREIKALQSAIEAEEAQIRADFPEEVEALAESESIIKKWTKAVKAACHALPIEELRTGEKFKVGAVSVSISKVSTVVEYSTTILADLPWLRDSMVDGSPAVIEAVNIPVVEYLLAEGDEDIRKYRSEVKSRNPSVSIKVAV